jgi:hypothetical protein
MTSDRSAAPAARRLPFDVVSTSPRPPLEPDDQHQWFSFVDPEYDRTYMVDLTFLRSRWTCIFGRGCQGVLTGPAPELVQGCCSYGAHFIDRDDVATVEAAVERLTAEQWQFRRRALKKGGKGWLATDDDGVMTTRLVEGACIFLNRPGFAGGVGCSLHLAAEQAGERFIDWKPDVCWQLPLRLEEHTDDHGHVTSVLREWKRRDWGAGGHEFHWWCTDDASAFVGGDTVYHTLRDEIIELVGEVAYRIIGGHLERTASVPLPHPALRKP